MRYLHSIATTKMLCQPDNDNIRDDVETMLERIATKSNKRANGKKMLRKNHAKKARGF